MLAPGESVVVPIVAFLDDAATCQDDIVVGVTESETQFVAMTARGTGHTIYCESEISDHDFGDMMTNVDALKVIKLENRGRRNQTVNWVNMTLRGREADIKKIDKSKLATVDKSLVSPFSVTPATCVVKPGQTVEFAVAALNDSPGDVSEKFELQVRGESERNFTTLSSVILHAAFVHPLLQFHPSAVDFVSLPGTEHSREHPIVQPVAITNTSPVDLSFCLSYVPSLDASGSFGPPVQLSHGEITLKAGEDVIVQAAFDPTYRNDKKVCISKPRCSAASPFYEHNACSASLFLVELSHHSAIILIRMVYLVMPLRSTLT
jgi:hypothetical protein